MQNRENLQQADPASWGVIEAAANQFEAAWKAGQPLAEGGMGQVSLAEDRPLQRQVLIKEIQGPLAKDPAVRQRFVAEARITGRLEHPGVVPACALGVDRQGQPFYAMRRVQGKTLAVAITEYHNEFSRAPVSGRTLAPGSVRGDGRGEGRARFRELLRRFVAVCQTVAYAHARGVLHRDLKPSNVMLGDFGETLVLDWGLASPVAGGDRGGRADAGHNRRWANASRVLQT